MSFKWSNFVDSYNHYLHELDDPRTADWLFVRSPWNPFLVTACYLYFYFNARSLTSKFPTYQLRSFIIIYNAMLVALSSYMSIEFILSAYNSGYSMICQPVDFSPTPQAIRMASASWFFYFSKYIELIETGLFALRKKYNQISVLHVYHHTTMIWICWWGVKYAPGGQGYIFGAINSFVHAVMYTYYCLSAFGPWIQKYLWWKKYLTMLQLSQFVILFFFCIQSLASGCNFSKGLCTAMVGYAVTLLVLFLNFYIKSYGTKNSKVQHEINVAQNGVKKID